MPRMLRKTFAGAKYHVTVRGNGRQKIFWSADDCERFLKQMRHALEFDGVVLYCYVLMQNHFHLLCATPYGNIQRFMQRLNTSYSMYFRYKHEKPGHCLQGRYKAKLVEGDEYLIRLTRYIHLNPVKVEETGDWTFEQKWRYLMNYRWSSLLGYMLSRFKQEMVDYKLLWLMMRSTERENRAAYRQYMRRTISDNDELMREALEASAYAVGDEEFVKRIEEELREMPLDKEKAKDVNLPQNRIIPLEEIEKQVSNEFGINVADLHVHGNRSGVAKAVVLELACQLGQKTNRDVGKYFGISGHGVGKQRERLRGRLEANPNLQRRIDRSMKALGADGQ